MTLEEEKTLTTGAGQSDRTGPLAFSVSPFGKLIGVLILAAGVIGAVYFVSSIQKEPVENAPTAEMTVTSPTDSTLNANAAPTDSIIGPEDLQGFDTEELTNKQRLWLYHKAYLEECSCGCGMNVAQCRVEDPTCPVSPGRSVELVKEASKIEG